MLNQEIWKEDAAIELCRWRNFKRLKRVKVICNMETRKASLEKTGSEFLHWRIIMNQQINLKYLPCSFGCYKTYWIQELVSSYQTLGFCYQVRLQGTHGPIQGNSLIISTRFKCSHNLAIHRITDVSRGIQKPAYRFWRPNSVAKKAFQFSVF